MRILVDGYNLAHSYIGSGHVSDAQRSKLLGLLNRFAKLRGHSVHVVFDGGMFSWPETEPYSKRMRVTFSGYNKDADTYIKQLLSQSKGKQMALVTSDNEVARWAARCNVVTISSEAFLEVMHERLRRPKAKKRATRGALVKTSTGTDPEIDLLMAQAMEGVVPPESGDGDEEMVGTAKMPALSKEEKKMQRILDKL